MDTLQSLLSLPEGASALLTFLIIIKRLVALIGVFIILWGALAAIYHFIGHLPKSGKKMDSIDLIRLKFGRTIILGLEFIVAADVIETTMAPDYYTLGILASLVGIRTLLTFFMNREMLSLSKRDL